MPWSPETRQELHGALLQAVREAEHHVESCRDCRKKVSKYRQLIKQLSNAVVSEAAPPGPECPRGSVDWHEVAAGLWPEFKAKQLIMHAALCEHCGPLLRAATFVDDAPTPKEAKLLAELRAPLRPFFVPQRVPLPRSPRWLVTWVVPALALTVILFMVSTRPPSPPRLFSPEKLAEFAVDTHRQYAQGNLALDVRPDSELMLNEWLKAKAPFSLSMPVSPMASGEERPYRLEGARLVPVGSKTAVYIAYQMQTRPVSLMVAPESVAGASGGVEANFKKVTFHYRTVEGYKVVTWSLHGNTYVLVSQEGNNTQRSCMVCHSAMRDRDLSQTPTPLGAEETVRPMWQ